MRSFSERAYDIYFEDVLRDECKKSKIDFTSYMTPEEREAAFMYLATRMQMRHPELQLVDKIVNLTNERSLDESQVLQLLGKTRFGTTVVWNDSNGNTHYYFNAGKTAGKKKNIIGVVHGENEQDRGKSAEEKIRKYFVPHLMLRNIRRMYDQIRTQELEKTSRSKKSSLLNSMFSEKTVQKKNDWAASGTFEREFKKEVKKAGFGVSPVAVCMKMVGPDSSMSKADKKIIFQGLKSLGVKSDKDLSALLNKWKEEALHESPKRRISRSNTMEMGL